MIPTTGRRVLPVDPDNQDDMYEWQKIKDELDDRETISRLDPRFYSSDVFELDQELSVRRKLTTEEILQSYS